jgi:hypothetical protein
MAEDLRAGTLADFANSMAAYMERAMQNEWQAVKGYALPASIGAQDRRILFAAVAQGVLKYLLDHTNDLTTTQVSAETHTHKLVFTVTAYRTPLP